MGNTIFHGDATSDAGSCSHHGSSVGNAAYLKMSTEHSLLADRANADALGGDGCDACSVKNRELHRRKWMLQMGTIVLMGISGLCLQLLIKPFATATTGSIKQYCQIEGKAYSIGSTARMTRSETGICLVKGGVAQWSLTSTAK